MSDKLSTKDVKIGGGGISKTLQPGNARAKINAIELEEFKFKKGAYNVLLHLEGIDMGPSFEGFWLDKDNQSLGRYKGQVGRIKAGEWAFADGETKSGIQIKRDIEIMKFLKSLCMALGESCMKWWDGEDQKHETIESLVLKFNTDKPFKDIFLEWCIAGKEYEDKKGYTQHDLFLPKFVKGGAPFIPITAPLSKLIKFSPELHIKAKQVKIIEGFGDQQPDQATPEVSQDFDL